MILQLVPLTSAILSLAWQGESGFTYTIQTSSNLFDWETLPYVTQGNGAEESYYLDSKNPFLFVRLQYDLDGDTDDNALPDLWEWQYFGHLGADPFDDPDLDEVSTYNEYLEGTDPTDYFDGEWPIIHVASGKEWLIPAGQISSYGVSIFLQKPSGEPWPNAPVQLSMQSGNASLEVIGSEQTSSCDSMIVWTDHMGRIDPAIESIHIRASTAAGSVDALVIRAGQADASIVIHSIGQSFGSPPRNLKQEISVDGNQVFSWSGDPGDADSFSLEERDSEGQWSRIINIATSDLSAPDPVDGSYLLTIQN